jgi:hypothetical protein
MTDPGEVERDKNGEGARETFASLAPSTRRGSDGGDGLLVADEVLLSAVLFSTFSETPSLSIFKL